MRYYFDIRHRDLIIPDDEGTELSTLEDVEHEAVRSLADAVMRSDGLVGDGAALTYAIDVRNENGPLLTVCLDYDRKLH